MSTGLPLFFSKCVIRRHMKGFTLIELLVATALLSIVMTSVYTLTHSSLRSWHFAEDGVDLHAEARNAITLFTHEFNNICGRAGHLFEGDDKELTMFVIAQPMDLKQGEGRRLMRVIYRYNRTKKRLEREEALVETALPKQLPNITEIDRTRIKLSREYKTTVAENVTAFKISYVWAPPPKAQPPDQPPIPEPLIYAERHSTLWGLPQGVKVEFTFASPDNEENSLQTEVTLPMRAPSVRLPKEQVEDLLRAKI